MPFLEPGALPPASQEAPLGARGFDHPRLVLHPDFRRLTEAAVASVEQGAAEPLQDALGPEPTAGALEVAAFAASSQGLAPLLATLPGLPALPPSLARFFASERRSSAQRAEALRSLLHQAASLLGGNGIRIVALKGATLAFRDYPEAGLRPMADLDLLLFDPGQRQAATRLLVASGWRFAWETTRHRVFIRPDERIVRPSCEDARNPIRIELHRTFALDVLGRRFDATPELLATAERRSVEGVELFLAAGEGLVRHLFFHAAGDFAASGLRGVQAYDFRLLARRDGPLTVRLTGRDRRSGLAPLAFAVEAVERLFPGSFESRFLDDLRRTAPAPLAARAAALSPLRHTRPPLGWTRRALPLAGSPWRKVRLLLRSAFPPLGEARINVAPDASGAALVLAWVGLFLRRAGRFLLHREKDAAASR